MAELIGHSTRRVGSRFASELYRPRRERRAPRLRVSRLPDPAFSHPALVAKRARAEGSGAIATRSSPGSTG